MILLILDQVHNVLLVNDKKQQVLPTLEMIGKFSSNLHLLIHTTISYNEHILESCIYLYSGMSKPPVTNSDQINNELNWIWTPIHEILAKSCNLDRNINICISQIYRELILQNYDKRLKNFQVWHFGMDKHDANELARLVLDGKKTATTSFLDIYKIENESIPEKGDISLIVNWNGIPLCIIETINVIILPFNEMTQEYARKEGEGDQSLDYWSKVHRKAFTEEANKHNMEFDENSTVVYEQFRVIKKISF